MEVDHFIRSYLAGRDRGRAAGQNLATGLLKVKSDRDGIVEIKREHHRDRGVFEGYWEDYYRQETGVKMSKDALYEMLWLLICGDPCFAVGFEQWVEKRRMELAAAAMKEVA